MNSLCRAALVSARISQIRNPNIGALFPINITEQVTNNNASFPGHYQSQV